MEKSEDEQHDLSSMGEIMEDAMSFENDVVKEDQHNAGMNAKVSDINKDCKFVALFGYNWQVH